MHPTDNILEKIYVKLHLAVSSKSKKFEERFSF